MKVLIYLKSNLKGAMKKLLIITAVLLSSGLTAQEKFISIVANEVDTTYRLIETTVSAKDTIATKALTRWLKQGPLMESMYLLARQAEAIKEQRELEAAQAEREISYYVATLDTLLGAGTYLKAVKAETQKGLQGNWKLIEVAEGVPNKTYTLVIEGEKATGAKEGTLEAQDSKSAKLTVQGIDLLFRVVAENALIGKDKDKIYYLLK